jgi:hypothetical protein
MTGHGAKFPRKMEEAIAALLSRPSVDEAARTIGSNQRPSGDGCENRNSRPSPGAAGSCHPSSERIQQGCGAAAAGTTILKLMMDPSKGIELEDIEVRLAE